MALGEKVNAAESGLFSGSHRVDEVVHCSWPCTGGGDDHVTVWSGCRDWFVPTEAVVELFIDVGHI